MKAQRFCLAAALILLAAFPLMAGAPVRAPRLASVPQGRILGGYQLTPGADGEFELFTNGEKGGMISLGRYNGQLAGLAVGRYDGRLFGLTRDGALAAYGDDPEPLAVGDARWVMLDMEWYDGGPLALSYANNALTLARLDREGKTWRADEQPIVRDPLAAKAVLVAIDDALHLLWMARVNDLSRGAIRHMLLRNGKWDELPPLPLGDVQSFTVYRQGDGLALTAIVPPPLGLDGEAQLVNKAWYDGEWLPAHAPSGRIPERLLQSYDLAGTWSENHVHWLATGADGAFFLSPHAAAGGEASFGLFKANAFKEEMRLNSGAAEEIPWSELTSLGFMLGLLALLVIYCRRSRMLSGVLPGRPADLTSRAAALAADWLLVSIGLSAYHIAAGDMRIYYELLTFGEVNRMFWINMGALSLFTLIGEAWCGQTPGKWLAGIRVRSVLGGPPSFLQALLRNLCRALDMFPVVFPGVIGAVTAMFNPRRQRFGDIVGATMVRRHAPLDKRAFILASASPRRLELLKALGLNVAAVPSEIDEDAIQGDSPEETARLLAEAKARAAAGKLAGTGASDIVVAADTMVVLDNDVLGKPRDAAEAKSMLGRLSGRSHRVVTGVTVWDAATGQVLSDVENTEVEFRKLSEHEIDDYVATGDPMDKAGAYGVQTASLVKEVRGSLSNVAGLPMELLQGMLAMLDS